MSKLEFNAQCVQDGIDELLSISNKLHQIQDNITACARSMNISERSLQNIRDSVYYINVGLSANHFTSFASVTRECKQIYENNERYLIDHVTGSWKEDEEKTVEWKVTDEWSMKFQSWIKDGYDTADDLSELFEIFGNNPKVIDFLANEKFKEYIDMYGNFKDVMDNENLKEYIKMYGLFVKTYDITSHFVNGEYKEGIMASWKAAVKELPKIANNMTGKTLSGMEVKLYYNFGKSIGENAMEHAHLLSGGLTPEELLDLSIGMTTETLYDFGMETAYEIVDTAASFIGIDYDQVLLDLTGKEGMEGVNAMMGQAAEEVTQFVSGAVEGTVKAVGEVGSYCGDFLADAGENIENIGKWIGGFF